MYNSKLYSINYFYFCEFVICSFKVYLYGCLKTLFIFIPKGCIIIYGHSLFYSDVWRVIMPTKVFGYIRVSSVDQNIDRQLDLFRSHGIDERDIFIDKQSGKNFLRPQYQALKSILREGDTLFVDALSRFGRNKADIITEWNDIVILRRVHIVVLNMPLLDTRRYHDGIEKLVSDLVLQLLGYFAEEERNEIRRAQRAGIDAAKKRGKHLGRPKFNFPDDSDALFTAVASKTMRPADAIRQLNISPSAFFRYLSEFKKHRRLG